MDFKAYRTLKHCTVINNTIILYVKVILKIKQEKLKLLTHTVH